VPVSSLSAADVDAATSEAGSGWSWSLSLQRTAASVTSRVKPATKIG
jgi:hypothetical protein